MPSNDAAGRDRLAARRAWLTGVAIFLLGVAFRLPWALQPRTVRWDEADYLILAQNLLQGRGYQVFGVPDLVWPPGAPGLAALWLAPGLPVDTALPLWHVVAGALACALLFGLSREVTGSESIAAIAGMLAAASPALAVWPLYWGSLTESPFLALLLAGLWATWRLLHGGTWRAGLAAGLAFGASYLVRTEGLFWWGAFLLILAGRAVWKRQGWLALATFLASFMLVATPYVLYLYQHTGRVMLSGKTGIVVLLSPQVIERGGLGQDYAATLDSRGEEILWLSPEQFEYSWLDSVRADPVAALRLLRANVTLAVQALVDPLLGRLLLGLAALGLMGEAWDRRRWAGMAFWLAALAPLGVLFISKVEVRYLVPLVPVVLVWAAQGMTFLFGWARVTVANIRSGQDTRDPVLGGQASAVQRPWSVGPEGTGTGLSRAHPHSRAWTAFAVALLAGVLVLGLAAQWRVASRGQASMTPSHEDAGRWLAANSAPGEAVMSRNTEVGLYADRPLIAFPNASWEEVLAYGRARGMRYLVTDDWELTELRPQLAPLLTPAQAPPELEHLATITDDRRTTLIYRVLPAEPG